MHDTTERVYGPYQNRNSWRVVVRDCSGRRVARVFASQTEAEHFITTVEARTKARTVERSLTDYYAAMAARGTAHDSIVTTWRRLTGLYYEVLAAPVGSITADRATALYLEYAATRAADTHRNTLGQARTAAKYWVRQGWLPAHFDYGKWRRDRCAL